jgi:hypothetical protein
MAGTVKPVQKDVYAQLGDGAQNVIRLGMLGYNKVKLFLSNQYGLIQKQDAKLYPIAVTAAAIILLVANFFSTLVFFTAGALYAIAKGDKWKEGLYQPLKIIWESSTIGKMGLVAGALFLAAPFKWSLAAFAFGIHVSLTLKDHHKAQRPGPVI